MTRTQAIIGFDDKAITCIIGMLPHERIEEQQLLVDLRLQVDIRACVQSDLLHDAIDYTAVASLVEEIAVQGRYQLVETLASKMAQAVMATYPTSWVWVRLRKPAALQGNGMVVIEVEQGVRQ